MRMQKGMHGQGLHAFLFTYCAHCALATRDQRYASMMEMRERESASATATGEASADSQAQSLDLAGTNASKYHASCYGNVGSGNCGQSKGEGQCMCPDGCMGADGNCYPTKNKAVATGFTLKNVKWPDLRVYVQRLSVFDQLKTTSSSINFGQDKFDLYELPGKFEGKRMFFLSSHKWPAPGMGLFGVPASQSDEKPVQKKISVVLIGSHCSGRSRFVWRASHPEEEWQGNYITTLGMDFGKAAVAGDRGPVDFLLWDHGGRERFRSIIRQQLTRQARSGFSIFVLCVANAAGLEEAVREVEQAESAEASVASVPKVIVATMQDLEDAYRPQQIREQLLKFGPSWAMTPVMAASAKSGEGVQEVLSRLAVIAEEKYLWPPAAVASKPGPVRLTCRERLWGLSKRWLQLGEALL